MIKLQRLADELTTNTYNYATLICERLVRGTIKDDSNRERVSELYDELDRKTEEYLAFVKYVGEQVGPLLPADDVNYMQINYLRSLFEDTEEETDDYF
jgi:hypothetical protein